MAYRQEHNIERICIEFPAEVDANYQESYAFYPRGYVGVDKIGRPVYCDRIGPIRVDKLFQVVTEEKMFRGLYYTFEHCLKHRFLACSAVFDRQIHQTLNIMDLNGFGMSMWTKTNMNLIKNMLRISQDYYPEMMGKLVICNAPMLFSAVYSVIKGWIDERTRKKISMCGSGYLKTLLEFIDEDQIP